MRTSLALGLLIVVLLVAIWFAVRAARAAEHFTLDQTRPVVSRVDGLAYRVHGGHTGPAEAADMLAHLNGRIIDLLRWLRARYVRGPEGAEQPERRAAVERLLARYNPDNLAENSPADPSGDTSYCIEKGAVVALCLRRRGGGDKLHALKTLTFVTLHEMAHIAVDHVDHPPGFWRAFRFLLEEAEAAGVYNSIDYARAPEDYCGVKINYNPRYDPATKPI